MDMSSAVASIDTLASRLERKFGLGSRPDLRRSLYERLDALYSDPEIGERVYQVVASAAADAVGKSKPGNYFAYVVLERLRERGIIQAPTAVF